METCKIESVIKFCAIEEAFDFNYIQQSIQSQIDSLKQAHSSIKELLNIEGTHFPHSMT